MPSARWDAPFRPPLPTGGGKGQTTCKPGSVPAEAGDGHSSGTPVTGRLARPTRTATRKPARRPLRAKAAGRHAVPTWSCSRWGLPCHSRCRERGALLPHPFALAGRPEVPAGGLLSVALSLGSPPPGVTRHRASVEPGLSSPAGYSRYEGGHPAVWHSHASRRRADCKPSSCIFAAGYRSSTVSSPRWTPTSVDTLRIASSAPSTYGRALLPAS